MPYAQAILLNTPWWVFALFALLVALGVQALRRRTVAVGRLVIIPIVFFIWGLGTLATRSAGSPLLILDWLAAGTIGLAIAWQTIRLHNVTIDRRRGVADVPGTAVPLVRNLVIFIAKYCLAAAMAIVPAWRADLLPLDIALSGLMAGFFIGWLVRFTLKYREASGHGAIASLS
jgi:hypothetical protein